MERAERAAGRGGAAVGPVGALAALDRCNSGHRYENLCELSENVWPVGR